MIGPKEVEKFFKKHKDNIEPRTVNLTTDQIQILDGLAEKMGISFEDAATVMMHVLFQELDKLAGEFYIQEQARRN